jgi:hypothetical protein
MRRSSSDARRAPASNRSPQVQAAVFTTRLVLSDAETALRSIRGKRSLAMLAAAAAGGYEHVVTELLRINADVDAKDKYASGARAWAGPVPCSSVARFRRTFALRVARSRDRLRSCAPMAQGRMGRLRCGAQAWGHGADAGSTGRSRQGRAHARGQG